MANDERPPLSGAELDVLKALWERGSGTVRQVNDVLTAKGKTWAYTTVMTLLQRLAGKGYATFDGGAAAYVYHPATSREELMRIRVQDVADELCEGATSALVLSLMENQKFSPTEIARLRRMVAKLDTPELSRLQQDDETKSKRGRKR